MDARSSSIWTQLFSASTNKAINLDGCVQDLDKGRSYRLVAARPELDTTMRRVWCSIPQLRWRLSSGIICTSQRDCLGIISLQLGICPLLLIAILCTVPKHLGKLPGLVFLFQSVGRFVLSVWQCPPRHTVLWNQFKFSFGTGTVFSNKVRPATEKCAPL